MQVIHCTHITGSVHLSSSSQRLLLSSNKALRRVLFISKISNNQRRRSFFTVLQPLASALDSFPDNGTEFGPSVNSLASTTDASGSFCIIEGPETVQDFAQLQLQEIRDNISSRRNKIFLLMEEVRRLRIQQRIKLGEHEVPNDDENEMPSFPSFIPFLPSLVKAEYGDIETVLHILLWSCGCNHSFWRLPSTDYSRTCTLQIQLELKLGLGGTSYEDFIRSMNLPPQLSEVDPIVASFSGGAVGVISSLMVVEVNNVKQQEQKRCIYCHGTGYLACARCSGSGSILVKSVSVLGSSNGAIAPASQRCPNCSGAARVMCPTCLCTGTALASEHDPRIDPFV